MLVADAVSARYSGKISRVFFVSIKRRKAVASIFRLEDAYFFAISLREQGWHHDNSSLIGISVDFFYCQEDDGVEEKIRKRAYKKTVSIVNETATEVYESYVGRGNGFLLESYDKHNGRYVFLGREPEAIITSRQDKGLCIQYKDGTRLKQQGNPVELLKQFYSRYEITKEEGELPFLGGLVGAFGYDYVRYQEELPDENEEELGIDTIQLMLVMEYITIDHEAETMTFVTLMEDSEAGYEKAQARLLTMSKEVVERYHAYKREKQNHIADTRDGIIVKRSDTLEEYSSKVNRIKHYIREGHIFQTVLSQRWTVQTGVDGYTLYQRLREKNPSPYMYYFKFPEFEIIGSSPEMIVKEKRGIVETCPIAGTRPRGKDEQEDECLIKELLADEKERAEHVMLVDLARNDMGRIAEFGTVKVARFMDIKKYSHVMHIVSLVKGKQRGTMHPLDLMNSFLPAGTLSGAPKIRAMEIIDELETVRRGLYGGAIGYIDFSGDMDFCITIRTMIKKGNLVYLQAGAGIVADSVPEKEYQECVNKMGALSSILLKEGE